MPGNNAASCLKTFKFHIALSWLQVTALLAKPCLALPKWIYKEVVLLYSILIADDEKEACEGITKRIDWEKIGYEVAGSAENGIDALEMAEKLHPDVLMTDIKMPYLNGLELCERLRKKMPSMKFIIFSGFDDFKFAQEAIKLNVAEYILKPVDPEELTATLKKIKCQLDREISEKCDVELLWKTYEQSLPIMRQQFFVGLIEGNIPKSQMLLQAKTFHADTNADGWAVALMRADPPADGSSSFSGREELIPISVKEILDGILQSNAKSRFVDFIHFDAVVVIAAFHGEKNIMMLCNMMNEACESVGRMLKFKAMAGVSTIKDDICQLRSSYQEASGALEYSAIMGGGKAIYIQDIEPHTPLKAPIGSEEVQAVVNAIKMGDTEQLKKKIDAVFSRQKDIFPTVGQYKIFLMELIASVLKVLSTYGIREEEIFSEDFSEMIEKFHTPDEMKQWCMKVCFKINSEIVSKRVNNTKLMAQNAEKYIQENYANPDISVDTLCLYLHVSPTYFSTVFKRETGKSFVSYLTDLRLQHAVDLLNTTEDKTYIIARKVGYFEPNYFSYVFKKKYGISPSRYRRGTVNENAETFPT